MPEPEAYTPMGPISDPAAATAPTNVAPSATELSQGQQQASGMYNLDPNYQPARDSVPQPQLRQTGFLGNGQMRESRASGGDPLFAATLAVPTFELDRSLQGIRQQKADIEQWMKGATDQFKGRAADPYQKAYQDYVSQEHNRFFDDIAQTYYGGDRSKAVQAARRDPELNRQFMNMNRSLGAIGDANKGGYDYYEKVADAVAKGQAEVDPETQKLLQSGLNGEWSFNEMGPAHNAAQFDRLNDRLSMNKLFNDFYQPGVKGAGDVTADKWSVESKGGRKFLVIPSETSYDEFVDSFVEQAMKDGPYRDEDEVRRFVEARVPREQTVKVDALGFPPSSGSSAPGSNEGKVWMGQIEVGPSATHPENQVQQSLVPGAPQTGQVDLEVERMPVGNVIGGRNENMTPKKFTTERGESITMQPQYIERDPLSGKFWVTGKLVGQETLETELVGLKGAVSLGNLSPTKKKEANERIKEITKKLADTRVPLSQNDAAMNGYMAGELQNALTRFPARKEGSKFEDTAVPESDAPWNDYK